MRGLRLERVVGGIALLGLSCGGGAGQTTDGGTGGTHGGSGGSGGSRATCGAVSACGGDIIGSWKVIDSCLTTNQDLSSVAGPGCTGASALWAFTYTGTLTYNGDGTFDSTIMGSATIHEQFPSGCNPFGNTCAQDTQPPTDAGASSTCSTDTTGSCTCDVVTAVTAATPTGTYSVSGTTLTTVQAGNTSTLSYCVQGGFLHEILDQPGSRQDGSFLVTNALGDLVLARQ
jgi:hypothetical protein